MTIGINMITAITNDIAGVGWNPRASLPGSKSPAKIRSTSPRRYVSMSATHGPARISLVSTMVPSPRRCHRPDAEIVYVARDDVLPYAEREGAISFDATGARYSHRDGLRTRGADRDARPRSPRASSRSL